MVSLLAFISVFAPASDLPVCDTPFCHVSYSESATAHLATVNANIQFQSRRTPGGPGPVPMPAAEIAAADTSVEADIEQSEPQQIRAANDAIAFCEKRFARLALDGKQEEFHIVTLNTKNHVSNTLEFPITVGCHALAQRGHVSNDAAIRTA